MWFTGVEVEQETSAPRPEKNPGSAPGYISYAKRDATDSPVCSTGRFSGNKECGICK